MHAVHVGDGEHWPTTRRNPNAVKVEWVPCYCTDRYEVSNTGFVRNAKTKRVLKAYLIKGYFRISLRLQPGAKAKKQNFLINRLVLLSFEGESEDPEKVYCAHVNSIDNRLSNLKWKDWYGNFEDKVANGTSATKLTPEDVAVMRNFYANGMSKAKIARRFNISQSHAGRAVDGYRWKHGVG